MRSDLWVTWIAMIVLVSVVAFSAGRHLFPSLDEPSRPGLTVSAGAARSAVPSNSAADLEPRPRSPELPGAGLSGGPPWPAASEPEGDWCRCGFANTSSGPCETCGWDEQAGKYDEDFLRELREDHGQWSDTPDHLEHLAARYYPPPEEEDFPTSPVFDALAAGWPRPQTSAPAAVAGPPPGDRAAGAGPEPPAPAAGERPSGDNLASDPGSPAGAGADPWQEIASRLDEDPDLNQWSIGAELSRCHEIVRELHQLGKALQTPYQLTPWKGTTA